jgi:hypothetical protein
MFTDKHHDPLFPVVVNQGKELAVPEDKDEGLTLPSKL